MGTQLYLQRARLKDVLTGLDCRANPWVWHAWGQTVSGAEYLGHFRTQREAMDFAKAKYQTKT
jgi:hypothetical protein